MSEVLGSACSGLMYSGVPIIWPASVYTVCAVIAWLIAFATPKSMTLRRGPSPSTENASMLLGLMSRWTIPLRCACWIASHACSKSFSRSSMESLRESQNCVIGSPLTCSIAKNGRPDGVNPPSSTFAIPGWFMTASACRSCSKRASTAFESIPALITFSATRCTKGWRRSASHTVPKPPSPIIDSSLNGPISSPGFSRD